MSPRLVRAAGLLLLACGAFAHARWGFLHPDLTGHALGSDDAFISFRFARNLARGHGLVFNPGEPVEGYSNLLYVLLLAPFAGAARGIALLHVSIVVGTLSAAAAFVVLYRRLGAAALLLPAAPITWAWAVSGMETAFVLLLQVLAFGEVWALEAEERPPRWRLPLWLGLWTLARADGFVGAGLVGGWLLVRHRRLALPTLGVVAGTTAALVAWRLAYYGAPLPNTYYAKVSGPPLARLLAAAEQLADLAWLAGLLPHLAVLTTAAAMALRRRRYGFEPAFAAVWLAFWLWVGGDVYGERFLVVLVPLAASALVRMGARPVVVAAVALVQLLPLATDRRFRYEPGAPRYDRWIEVGRVLSAPEHRGGVLATDAAGKMPFVSDLVTIDMLGLVDAHIARLPAQGFRVGHNKHDAAYVLAHRPDLVATWITPALDLRWDLPHARWEKAGYRLRYLAFTRRRLPAGEPVVLDVRRAEDDVGERIRRGWNYAVLERARP